MFIPTSLIRVPTVRVSAFSTLNAGVQQPCVHTLVDNAPYLEIFEHVLTIGVQMSSTHLLCATTLPVSALSAHMLSPIA